MTDVETMGELPTSSNTGSYFYSSSFYSITVFCLLEICGYWIG